jgi:CBS domain-containing protein
MRVRDLMCPHVSCCTPDTSLRDAALTIADGDCALLPVVSPGNRKQVVGVLTDRDIVRGAVARGKDPDQTSVADCMSRPLPSIHQDISLEDCCESMEAAKAPRILVVNEHGELCGIISHIDVVLQLGPNYVDEGVFEFTPPLREAPFVP